MSKLIDMYRRIGMIPTSYKVAMTYEEQLLWLCEQIENWQDAIELIQSDLESIHDSLDTIQGSVDELILWKNNSNFVYQDDLSNYYDKEDIDDLLQDKQDTLIAGQNITIENGIISATGGSDMNYDFASLIHHDEYIDLSNLSVGDTLSPIVLSLEDTAYLETSCMTNDKFEITGQYSLVIVDDNDEVLEVEYHDGNEPFKRTFIAGASGTLYISWSNITHGVQVLKIIDGKYIEDNLDLIYGGLESQLNEIGELNLGKQNKLVAKRFIKVNTESAENDIEAFGRNEVNITSEIVPDEYIDLSGNIGTIVNMSTIAFEDTAYIEVDNVLQNTTIKLIGKGTLVVLDSTNTILEKHEFPSNSYYTTTFNGKVVVSWTQTDLYTPYCYLIDTIIDFDYEINANASDSKVPTSKAVKNYIDSQSGITNETSGTTSIVTKIWSGTETEYNALASYDSTTLYFIKE